MEANIEIKHNEIPFEQTERLAKAFRRIFNCNVNPNQYKENLSEYEKNIQEKMYFTIFKFPLWSSFHVFGLCFRQSTYYLNITLVPTQNNLKFLMESCKRVCESIYRGWRKIKGIKIYSIKIQINDNGKSILNGYSSSFSHFLRTELSKEKIYSTILTGLLSGLGYKIVKLLPEIKKFNLKIFFHSSLLCFIAIVITSCVIFTFILFYSFIKSKITKLITWQIEEE